MNYIDKGVYLPGKIVLMDDLSETDGDTPLKEKIPTVIKPTRFFP